MSGGIYTGPGGELLHGDGKPVGQPEPAKAEHQLRVWWIPQVPMEPFHMPVRDIREAQLLLKALALYDTFQLEHNIKPDYCNIGGLEVFEEGEWLEWESFDGDHINDIKEE